MAGGMGTRGRPYTEYFPKAMTPVSDKPLIDHIVRYVRSFEFVDGVIIISDYNGLGGQILNYYGASVWTGTDSLFEDSALGAGVHGCACDGGDATSGDAGNAAMTFVQDSQSGTGGDLLHIYDLIPDGEPFVLWFVDNLCAVDLYGMRGQFEKNNSIACIATRTKRTEATGFAIVAKNGADDCGGIVSRFVEKPVMNLPSSECLGVYVLDKSILDKIADAMKRQTQHLVSEAGSGLQHGQSRPDGGSCENMPSKQAQVNLSHDILEDLSGEGKVSAFDIGDSEWVDVESPAILERNASKISGILAAMKDAAK